MMNAVISTHNTTQHNIIVIDGRKSRGEGFKDRVKARVEGKLK